MAGVGGAGQAQGGGGGGRIFYGAVTLQEREKIARATAGTGGGIPASGATDGAQTLPFSESMRRKQEEYEATVRRFEAKKPSERVAVPTNDLYVKLRLRELGEPICLFGESKIDRRERLRDLMLQEGITEGMPVSLGKITGETMFLDARKDGGALNEEEFFTEGSKALQNARRKIALFSLPRAMERVKREQERDARVRSLAEKMTEGVLDATAFEREAVFLEMQDEIREEEALLRDLSDFTSTFSVIGDTRAVSCCSFQRSGSAEPSLLVTGSWSGACKLWTVKDGAAEEAGVLIGHQDRVNDVKFHPNSGMGLDEKAANLASSGADHVVNLWSLEEAGTPLATLSGHTLKVSRSRFHPEGSLLASGSFDHTWRLWDLETQKELLLQEGHSRPVTDVSFHPDGSLLCSTSCDATSRVWDLRSGRSVVVLTGHVKPVICCDFSSNGYELATGSDDHTVKVWDLRKAGTMPRSRRLQPSPTATNPACVYTILAHTKLVTNVRYEEGKGRYLITSSLDRLAKVWCAKDFTPVRTLAGHEDKIMGLDVSSDSSAIVTSSYDKTWKLWAVDSL